MRLAKVESTMYAHIEGIVKMIRPSHIVIDNQGIGYLIIVPNPYAYKIDDHTLVYTHHYVREDMDHLYGFQRMESKELFIALIGVSGIGPKSALSMLATDAIEDIRYAIEHGNAKYLTNFPGIGNKSAQQIILDLKGKLTDLDDDVSLETNDVQDALLALGYSKTEVKRVLKKINHDEPVEAMIKSALRLLIK